MAQRVGLLGGTFDPPHLGHLVVAEAVRVALGLDQVRLLVAGDPWMKSSVSGAEDRVDLATAAVGSDANLHVDEREVRRGGPTYTADTLAELSAEEPGTAWWFVLGVDAANGLPQWERGEEALALATFVAVTRPGFGLDLPDGYAERVQALSVPHVDVSSTTVRERYRTGQSTRYLVPDEVDALVRERGLYGVGHD